MASNKSKKFKQIKKILSNSSIGIAGLGGLGSNAAISLARLGIGHLLLIDYDTVEEENLNRQYYFKNQIGMKKIDAIKAIIEKINPNVNLDLYDIKLKKGSISSYFTNVDVIIEALDDAKIKTEFIEEILTKLPNKNIIAASGVTGFKNPDRIKTKKLGKLLLCQDDKALSTDEDMLYAPRVCLIANWEANLAVELILSEKNEHNCKW
jgi:sulfur carrier protein ThiS adenylyltransferase